MPRERPTYRAELEQILAYFKDKKVLSVSDMERYLHKSRSWVEKHVSCKPLTAVQFAYELTHLNE